MGTTSIALTFVGDAAVAAGFAHWNANASNIIPSLAKHVIVLDCDVIMRGVVKARAISALRETPARPQ